MIKDYPNYSRKKSIIILSIACIMFILSIVVLVLGTRFCERGYQPNQYLPFLIIGFSLVLLDIVFVLFHYKNIVLKENIITVSLMMSKKVLKIDNASKASLFLKNKRLKKLDEGYYFKHKLSFKGGSNFYIKNIQTKDVSLSIDEEMKRFENHGFEKNNKVFILFMEKEYVSREDLENLVYNQDVLLTYENIPNVLYETAVFVLYDNENNCSYIVKPGSSKSNYATGYSYALNIMYYR